MLNNERLMTGIHEFKLDVAGVRVFPVYWINTRDYAEGFRAAKGTPDEMQSEADRIISACVAESEEFNVRDEQSARNFLYRNHIGIDCSAFVFHLVNRTLTPDGQITFQSSLFIPKGSLIESASKDSWRSEYELTPEEAAELPDMVPLDWVCSTFNKEPQFQVNVARLCSDAASVAVGSLEDAEPGDLIYLKRNGKSKHVAMVTQVNGNLWEAWDSYREDGGYGGIMPHEIKIIDPRKPLEHQQWSYFDKRRYDDYSLRRLRAFSS